MQLSVELYKAIAVDRGASLDTLDYPLNNRRWLEEQFARIRKFPPAPEGLTAIREDTLRAVPSLAASTATASPSSPGP